MAEVPPLILPLLSFYMPLSLPLPCSLLPAPCSHFTAIPPVSCSPPSQRKKASPAAEERVSVKMSLAQLRVFIAMYRGRDQGPRGGAEHLARIHGTEEDKVNCPFYFKIGACRHGDKCSRQHHRPPFSETILIQHMWNNPTIAIASAGGNLNHIDKGKFHEALDDFYEEIFEEFSKYGKLEDIQVCENLGDHMVGNVYVKYYDEEDAQEALTKNHERYYAGRTMLCEYSPVTEFREARCRQFDEGTCARGPYCNFMHVCEPSSELRRHLQKEFDFRGGRMKGTGDMGNLRGGGGGGGGDRGRSSERDHRGDRDSNRDSRYGDRERSRDGDRDRRGDSRDRRGRERSRDRGDRDRDSRRSKSNDGERETKRQRASDEASQAAPTDP
ncbi:hypothetical protein B484DRAFT_417361 [Ochromonadaceae sp. CCMP2298]|nr:hypothetical protein B484DRAFT_417361 [Ochromonadaceae sp. CCMP2298]